MYDQLISWQNLLLAYRKASKGKRGGANVAAFEHRLEENLIWLQYELRAQRYQPGEYTNFYIHEPKRRLISAAPFRDRVVHHALCNLIEPIFERSFIDDSFANRVGKGTHRAVQRCQQFARKYRFVLQCDIKQFFPSIDHSILYEILSKKITDRKVLWLVSKILQSGQQVQNEIHEMIYFPGDDLFSVLRKRGLPIGNLTSQFWANVYLNPFDHFIKRELRCGGYVRYVDDFLLFADNKDVLWSWLACLKNRLMCFRLSLHTGAHPRPVTEGIPFLGFVIYPDRRRLKRRKGIYFQRKYNNMVQSFRAGAISIDQITESVRGWINHVRYGNTVGLRKAILCRAKRIRTR